MHKRSRTARRGSSKDQANAPEPKRPPTPPEDTAKGARLPKSARRRGKKEKSSELHLASVRIGCTDQGGKKGCGIDRECPRREDPRKKKAESWKVGTRDETIREIALRKVLKTRPRP